MDRSLAPENITRAFGGLPLGELPTLEEFIALIAQLEIELVRGLTEDGFRTNVSPLRNSAWYLHGIASTSEASPYSVEQRRRAFAVSAHVLDLLLENQSEPKRIQLATAFAAQVGYHRADESPNAGAIFRKIAPFLTAPAKLTEGPDLALQAGILFLSFDTRALNQHLHTWREATIALTRAAQLANLDGTMFGSTQRLLHGIEELGRYLREGSTVALEDAREHLLKVVRAEVGLSDLTTRWVAGHLLSAADGFRKSSLWAVLPPDVPLAVKQAFTLSDQPILTLWPPQRSLAAHPTMSPLKQSTSKLLVSVPTSAGKTLLAQLIICTHAVQTNRGVCYVTPLRSLGREMRQSLLLRLSYLGRRLGSVFPDSVGLNNPMSMGFENADGSSAESDQVEIMTPERLMNALRQSPQDVLSRFSLFIIDEAHLIAQRGGRGLLLEGLLTLLDASGARLILFSGVIGNAAHLAAWTSNGKGEVLFTDEWRAPRRLHIITTSEKIDESRTIIPSGPRSKEKIQYDLRARLMVRPTKETEQYLVTSNDSPIGKLVIGTNNKRINGKNGTTSNYAITAKTAALLLQAGSLLMVVSRRSIARNAAQEIAADLKNNPRSQNLANFLAAQLGKNHPLVACVRKGVAYHHAGLPAEVQEAIEDAIRNELIKAVVATSTLTDGVNLPVRTVVIATSEYSGQDPSQRMSAAQLLNAVGRAGRAGKESEGWIVLALQKSLQSSDFDRLKPSPSELEVHSSLTQDDALTALSEAEVLIANTEDAILQIPPDNATGGFVNYVWFVLHMLEEIPALSNTRTWRDIVTRLFAFTQLAPDLQERWLKLADHVVECYDQTSSISRRRWAQAGTSLKSAAAIEALSLSLAEQVELIDGVGELTFDETLSFLSAQDVFAKLLQLPERGKCWNFRTSPRGDFLEVDPAKVIRDWVAGLELAELANTYLSDVKDPEFRLEQMVDAISEGMQHYLSWIVGLVVNQTNEILLSRFSLRTLCMSTSAHIRYGVNTTFAIRLLASDIKSRRLAQTMGQFAASRALDDGGLQEYLNTNRTHQWQEDLGASAMDIPDLLQFAQNKEKHQLAEIMDSGYSSARIQLISHIHEELSTIDPIPVSLTISQEENEIHVSTTSQSIIGFVVATDHAGVAAALNSGLLIEFTLRSTTLMMRRIMTDS
ncbi:DEAD/DEAH box helicase [Corynebacterium sp. YIM 101645]|uniref:DEAD/DEAH box helicase n=1 Tax=Corynebacterium lemuris TaxID=1859292 RepID=A0ABT2G3D7_9CORY|nr:DEAD/DEAH box helicase [Corynebacterium lemuris]MCS5480802.1 DEAD/DEAH box helicase [Corynebacterium lemuris]